MASLKRAAPSPAAMTELDLERLERVYEMSRPHTTDAVELAAAVMVDRACATAECRIRNDLHPRDFVTLALIAGTCSWDALTIFDGVDQNANGRLMAAVCRYAESRRFRVTVEPWSHPKIRAQVVVLRDTKPSLVPVSTIGRLEELHSKVSDNVEDWAAAAQISHAASPRWLREANAHATSQRRGELADMARVALERLVEDMKRGAGSSLRTWFAVASSPGFDARIREHNRNRRRFGHDPDAVGFGADGYVRYSPFFTEDAETVVELSDADWCAFVLELQSTFALLYGGRDYCTTVGLPGDIPPRRHRAGESSPR